MHIIGTIAVAQQVLWEFDQVVCNAQFDFKVIKGGREDGRTGSNSKKFVGVDEIA